MPTSADKIENLIASTADSENVGNELLSWLKAELTAAFEVRYADDGLLCFQYREDAEPARQVHDPPRDDEEAPARSLKATAVWCREHRHDELAHQWTILNAKLRGHYQYYGRPTNSRSIRQFYRTVRRLWHKWLNRRTRGRTLDWPTYARLLDRYPLLRPAITRTHSASLS
jgi:hypothetical protein